MATNDNDRNKKIMEEIEVVIKKYEDEKFVLMGDFNAHLGYIGNQPLNRNERNVLKLINKYDLILLNDDPICIGEVTREQGNNKSVIDFILVNSLLYNKVINMKIDDDNSNKRFDISDHNLITVKLELEIII